MDLNDKLKNFPHVYYFNLDKEVHRREYMEAQFKQYGINYTRVPSERFRATEILSWIDVFHDGQMFFYNKSDLFEIRHTVLANFASHMIFLKEWYESSDEDVIVLMEDDYDLSIIDYWHFDWDYFMSRIPYDWDTIQLGYEHPKRVQFFISHKDYISFNFGPTLINRRHVKKILDLFFKDGKIVTRSNSVYPIRHNQCSVDFTINHIGKNYTVPLITTNTDLFQEDNDYIVYKRHHTNRYIYHYWWKNKRDKFSLDDFFTMYKENDEDMTEYLQNYESRALSF